MSAIDGIECGASKQTCQMGGADYPEDLRPYSIALADSFPFIRQWSEGRWSDDSTEEFHRFFRTAIGHGSFPMLAVVGIVAHRSPAVVDRFCQELDSKRSAKLKSLLNIGIELDDLSKYIEEI